MFFKKKVEYEDRDDNLVPSIGDPAKKIINGEGYTYGQLRHKPMIDEVLVKIKNPKAREWAEECNHRSRKGGRMKKINGEYSFEDLRVGPKVKLPPHEEYEKLSGKNNPSSEDIRKVNYQIVRNALAKKLGISPKEAGDMIGQQFVCIIHEDQSGYAYMVPQWAHEWFRHDGYVSKVKKGGAQKSGSAKAIKYIVQIASILIIISLGGTGFHLSHKNKQNVKNQAVESKNQVFNNATPADTFAISEENSDLKFAFDSPELSEKTLASIKDVADLYNKSSRTKKLVIRGYACNIGDDAPNNYVSKQRAEAVKNAFIQYGVSEDNIKIEWFGKSKNAEFNLPNNADNRRVLISIE